MSKSKRSLAVVAASVGLLIAGMVAPASAAGNAVRGELSAFAAGTTTYPEVAGHAQLVRTADGKTIVTLHASGLLPGKTYPTHLHAKACGDSAAGGHYKIDTTVAGTVAGNEIWPGPITTDGNGVANGKARVDDHSARADAVSVVVHAWDTGAKIACADLA